MRTHAYIAIALLTACSSSPERIAEDALRAGNMRYAIGDHAGAVQRYSRAEHDVHAMHNRAYAHHQLGEWGKALADVTLAAQLTEDSLVQEREWQDLGHLLVAQALWADSLSRQHADVLSKITIEGDDIARKVSLFVLRDSLRRETRRLGALADSSLVAGAKAYRETLRRAPRNEDARHDLALTMKLIALRPKPDSGGDGGDKNDQKELGEKARLIIERADQLVEEHKFKEALRLLQEGLKQDPSLEQRKEYMDKLETVDRAAQAT
ncbi:MAG: hypothetical protein KIT10_01700 [Flavobacteriales bacterium]|nr:hypothetical protein [Flavobacteriales bacterium]